MTGRLLVSHFIRSTAGDSAILIGTEVFLQFFDDWVEKLRLN
jgi:hypothetical protein